MDIVGEIVCGRYRVVRLLGAGGMGTVYLAEHTFLDRLTALKILSRDWSADPFAEERFRREAMLAARIDHPAVAQIYDFDRMPEGEFVLAMEYVDGETVRQHLQRSGPFSLKLAVRTLQTIASGLDRAHSLKILHRDLKPENVMLAQGGAVKLLDFGVARSLDSTSDVSSSGFAIGTPAYMSPEQLTADTLGPESDIYSLGIVFYEMLTGTLPHAAPSVEELRVQRLIHPPLSLDRVRPECSAQISAVVERALHVTPSNRWPSAGAFAEAVAASLTDSVRISTAIPIEHGPGAHRLDRWEAHFEALRFGGREREVRQVRDAWATARANRTMVLWIEGDEGSGKSAFFELARRDAATDGAAELVGRGYQVDVARPYGPWHPMLRTALSFRGADGRSWPAIEALTDARQDTPVTERAILFDEVAVLLRTVAQHGLLFVGMEDADSCDPASLALLEFLISDLRALPVLFAVTSDTHPGPETGVRETRERLRRVSGVEWVKLRPLGYDALFNWFARALEHEPPDALVRYVYGHTEGNAFFIEQVVRSLVEQGNLEHVSDEQLEVMLTNETPPEALAEVVRRRLRHLSPAAREIVQLAAVVGREFDVDLVLQLSQRSEDQVLDALDEAQAAGVLVPITRAGGDWYRFTHGKIGDVHAQSMNQRRRRQLHARIAQVLEHRADTPADVLAQHWRHADEPARACPYALQAARRALELNDCDDAVSLAAMAAETSQGDEDRSAAHELRGDALRRLDRYPEAAAAYARAHLATTGSHQAALRCKEIRSALLAGAMNANAATVELDRILAEADQDPSSQVRLFGSLALAEALLASGRYEEAIKAAECAHEAATATHHAYKQGDALILLGQALLEVGHEARAAEVATAAGSVFGDRGDAYGLARVAMLQGTIAAASGDRHAANAAFDRAVIQAERARVTRLVRVIVEQRAAVVDGDS